MSKPNCAITDGTWLSSYDGATGTDPGDLDIDHIVPLAEVMRSGRIVDGRRVGPRDWTQEARERYANDPEGLITVTATTNRAQGRPGHRALAAGTRPLRLRAPLGRGQAPLQAVRRPG